MWSAFPMGTLESQRGDDKRVWLCVSPRERERECVCVYVVRWNIKALHEPLDDAE